MSKQRSPGSSSITASTGQSVYMVYPRDSDNPVMAQAVAGLRELAMQEKVSAVS